MTNVKFKKGTPKERMMEILDNEGLSFSYNGTYIDLDGPDTAEYKKETFLKLQKYEEFDAISGSGVMTKKAMQFLPEVKKKVRERLKKEIEEKLATQKAFEGRLEDLYQGVEVWGDSIFGDKNDIEQSYDFDDTFRYYSHVGGLETFVDIEKDTDTIEIWFRHVGSYLRAFTGGPVKSIDPNDTGTTLYRIFEKVQKLNGGDTHYPDYITTDKEWEYMDKARGLAMLFAVEFCEGSGEEYVGDKPMEAWYEDAVESGISDELAQIDTNAYESTDDPFLEGRRAFYYIVSHETSSDYHAVWMVFGEDGELLEIHDESLDGMESGEFWRFDFPEENEEETID